MICLSECSSVCITLWDPVCGSDGVTYGNDCELNVASCQNPGLNIIEAHSGQCEDDSIKA